MLTIAAIFGLLMPAILPTMAFVLTSRLSKGWRWGAALLANFLSFPIGFVLMVPEILTGDANAGVGIAGIPVMLTWLISLAVIAAWVAFDTAGGLITRFRR